MSTATPILREHGLATGAPEVEIVVPVFNEEAVLGRSIRRLHAYLEAEFARWAPPGAGAGPRRRLHGR
jgi:hypothetical protein